MLSKKSFFYRFFVLFLVWAVLGVAILTPLGGTGIIDPIGIYIGLGVWAASFIIFVIVNEIIVKKKEKGHESD